MQEACSMEECHTAQGQSKVQQPVFRTRHSIGIYFLKNELEVTEQGKTGGRNERQEEGTVWGRAVLGGGERSLGQIRVWGSKD